MRGRGASSDERSATQKIAQYGLSTETLKSDWLRRSKESQSSFVWITCLSEPESKQSELAEPAVTLKFYEISSRGRKLLAETSEPSAFLKKYIARRAGEAGSL